MNNMKKEEILKARAEKLMQIQANEEKIENYLEVLIFSLSHEIYAIESKFIKEVYPIKDLTIFPCVPNFIYGVINVRRKIYSIVDLKYFFGLPPLENDSKSKIIILENKDNSFGIIVDYVDGIKSILESEIQTQLPVLTDIKKEFLKGIANNNLIVLDGYKLINSELFIVNEKVTP